MVLFQVYWKEASLEVEQWESRMGCSKGSGFTCYLAVPAPTDNF